MHCYQAFASGLAERFEKCEVDHFKYVGADEGPGLAYMTLNNGPTVVPYETKCVCGHEITVNCYLRHIPTGVIVVVGTQCVRQFLPTGMKRTCAQCSKVHRNNSIDLCNGCSKACNTAGCKNKVRKVMDFCPPCLAQQELDKLARKVARVVEEQRIAADLKVRIADAAVAREAEERRAVAFAAERAVRIAAAARFALQAHAKRAAAVARAARLANAITGLEAEDASEAEETQEAAMLAHERWVVAKAEEAVAASAKAREEAAVYRLARQEHDARERDLLILRRQKRR